MPIETIIDFIGNLTHSAGAATVRGVVGPDIQAKITCLGDVIAALLGVRSCR